LEGKSSHGQEKATKGTHYSLLRFNHPSQPQVWEGEKRPPIFGRSKGILEEELGKVFGAPLKGAFNWEAFSSQNDPKKEEMG